MSTLEQHRIQLRRAKSALIAQQRSGKAGGACCTYRLSRTLFHRICDGLCVHVSAGRRVNEIVPAPRGLVPIGSGFGSYPCELNERSPTPKSYIHNNTVSRYIDLQHDGLHATELHATEMQATELQATYRSARSVHMRLPAFMITEGGRIGPMTHKPARVEEPRFK